MPRRVRFDRHVVAAARLVVLAVLLAAGPAAAKDSEAIPFLKNVPSCNPALGSDCAQTPKSDPQCVVDADCTMGCAKNQPLDDQTPSCRPTDNTSATCLATLGNPLQKGVACGCLSETHKCGYIPAPQK